MATRSPSIDALELVNRWSDSVEIIARGTEKNYDDYYVYVSWREAIDNVASNLSVEDARILDDVVSKADQKFRHVTRDDRGVMVSSVLGVRSNAWYWRRVPKEGSIAESFQEVVDLDGGTLG